MPISTDDLLPAADQRSTVFVDITIYSSRSWRGVPNPPAALRLTSAIFSAPPAVAGNAWFAVHGGRIDLVETLLLGTFVVLILVQPMILGANWRLPFTLGFWVFTFTATSSGTYTVHWLALWGGPGHAVWAWFAIALVTILIGSIAVRSAALLTAHSRIDAQGVAPSAQLL